jgi:CO/xanthine dehydrogenase Mo-binding subunit
MRRSINDATSVIGQDVPAQDARERVNGKVKFAINHEVPGMLHAKVLRATSAHARIVRLDVSRAERLSGVAGVLSGHDLRDGGINPYYGPIFPDRPLVALDKVRYAGEPVAVVIAKDADTATEALELIDVEYNELPAAIDPESAIAPNAESIHDTVRQRGFTAYPDLVLNIHRQGVPAVLSSDAHAPEAAMHTDFGKNIANHFKIRKGNIEEGFREADEIFEDAYRTPAQQHASLEPHVAICRIEDDQVTIWSSSSSPYTARFQVAETLGVPQSKVQVITWYIGGAFGGKTYPRIEPLLAAACWKVGGRPVRLEFSRSEEFYTISRHAAHVTLRTGVKRDGTIVARKVRVLYSGGAYADVSPRVCKNGGYASPGPYHIPNVWVDSYAVYTNVTPAGGFRGYGVPQVAWAYENQMDQMAHALGIDPVEMRERNALKDGDTFSTGQVMRDAHYRELIEDVRKNIGWRTPKPSRLHSNGNRAHTARGKGIAVSLKGTITPSTSTASIKLNEDGSVSLLVSTTEIGQGARTALCQIAADAVGVPYEQVSPSYPDTGLTPWDQTTSSSRSTAMMGGAIRLAGEQIRNQVRSIASDLLEVSPDDLQIADGAVWVRGVPGKKSSLGELVRKSRAGNLLGSGIHTTEGKLDPDTGQGTASMHFFQAAGAVEVEVDLQTGRVTILDLYLTTYAGKVINPTFAELQSEGNVTFGIGQALFEEMVVEGGQVVNASLADYMIPSIEDFPKKLKTSLVEDPSGEGEVHGIGESGVPLIAPAISNAIYNACGVRITTLPITPEKVLRGLMVPHEQHTTSGPS